MPALPSFLTLIHLLGLVLGVGAASVKLALLLKCKADSGFVSVFVQVARPITRLLVLGLILLTLSGIGWLLLSGGYPFTPRFVLKLVLVAAIWVMGPIIDKVVEPKFCRLAPASNQAPSAEFIGIQRQYLALEIAATGAFYAIIIIWVLY